MKRMVKSFLALIMSVCIGIVSCIGSFAVEDVAESKNWKIVLVGDSLCAGYRAEGCYNFTGTTPKNIGVNGRDTEGLLNNISDAYGDYDKMFIICGINDFKMYHSWESIYNDGMTHYKQILENVHKNMPNTHIYVTGIFPTSGRFVTSVPHSIEYNKRLKNLCSEYSYVTYISECWDALYDSEKQSGRTDYTDANDGLHINKTGYAALSNAIRPYIYEDPLSCDIFYQLNNKDRSQLRFVAEMNIEDVQKAESGSYTIKLNDNDDVNVEITNAYKAIMSNGTKITAPEGKCYVITSVIKNCSAGDEILAEFNLDGFYNGISRLIKY